ncbi:MAG: EamA family transporter [Patescibacteria group bacterium]|jgi:drug/metabolite transporter (DMT)-like permease
MYIFLSLTAAFFYSLSGIAGKITTKYKIKNLYSLIFWLNVTALIFLPFLWAKAGHIQNPLSWPYFAYIATTAVATLLTWKALYSIDVSVYQSLFNIQTIFVTLLSFIVLGERFPVLIYLSIALTVLGGILVSYNDKQRLGSIFNKNILLMLLAVLLYAATDIFVKLSLNTGLDPFNFQAWSLLGVAVLLSPTYFLAKKEIRVTAIQIFPLFLSNLFIVSAQVLVFIAFLTNVAVSQALAMFGSFFTLLITGITSRYYPTWLEKNSSKTYIIRLTGCAVLIAAVLLILRFAR